MKIEDFIKEYKESNDKEKYIEKHILKRYIPYEEKIAVCKNIILSTYYKDVDGKNIYTPNTPYRYLMFSMLMINKYSDIELTDNILNDFNLLSEYCLIDFVLSKIPKNEFETMEMILNMCRDDLLDSTRSIVGFLENKSDSISILMNTIKDVINEYLEGNINND